MLEKEDCWNNFYFVIDVKLVGKTTSNQLGCYHLLTDEEDLKEEITRAPRG